MSFVLPYRTLSSLSKLRSNFILLILDIVLRGCVQRLEKADEEE